MKEAARQQVSVVARKRLDRSSNGDSKRTLNPEYQREESKLDRKKVLEAHHLHSSFSLAAVPLPDPLPAFLSKRTPHTAPIVTVRPTTVLSPTSQAALISQRSQSQSVPRDI